MASNCLAVCRWCCCCFLAVINVLTTILGIAFFILGCFAIWGYWAMRQLTETELEKLAKAFKESGMNVNVDTESIHKAVETAFQSCAAIFLVLGILLIIVSCLGCCGACFGVPTCLIIYSVIVGLVFLAQTVVIIIWFADNNIIKRCLRSSMVKSIGNYKGLQNMDSDTMNVDLIQIAVGCCGVDSGEDFYTLAPKWNRTLVLKNDKGQSYSFNLTYPYSCCKYTSNMELVDNNCIYNSTNDAVSNRKIGCYEKLSDILDTKLKLNNFFRSLAGSLGMEVLLIIGALVIFCYKRQEQADVPHSGVQYKMQPQMA